GDDGGELRDRRFSGQTDSVDGPGDLLSEVRFGRAAHDDELALAGELAAELDEAVGKPLFGGAIRRSGAEPDPRPAGHPFVRPGGGVLRNLQPRRLNSRRLAESREEMMVVVDAMSAIERRGRIRAKLGPALARIPDP